MNKGILSKLPFSTSNFSSLTKKPFVRNVITVASGTAAVQAINLLFSPIITRIYGPEAFGILGVFLSIITIVTPIAAMTYPIAIVLPKEENHAKGLLYLSLNIALILSAIMWLIVTIFGQSIVELLQIAELAPYLIFIPIIMVFTAALQVTQQWMIRHKKFKQKAKVAVIHALLVNSTKIGLGLFQPIAFFLILITTLGYALHSLLLAWNAKILSLLINPIGKSKFNRLSIRGIDLAKTYMDFPLYRASQEFINSVSRSLPVLMLTIMFGPVAVGLYVLGNKVLALPAQLIGNSVGDVFYPRITEAANNNESISNLLIRATTTLAVIGLIPFGLVVVFGPWLFSFVFGEEWLIAGEYSRWLAIWSYIVFINNPSVKALPVLSAQQLYLYITIGIGLLRVIALAIGGYLFESDIIAIALFAIAGATVNLLLIIMTIVKSISYDKSKNKKTNLN